MSNGKGSARRPENTRSIAENWQLIKWPRRGGEFRIDPVRKEITYKRTQGKESGE